MMELTMRLCAVMDWMIYVVFGKNGTWTAPLELSSINGSNGFKFGGVSRIGYWCPNFIRKVGDTNGDGIGGICLLDHRNQVQTGAYMLELVIWSLGKKEIGPILLILRN